MVKMGVRRSVVNSLLNHGYPELLNNTIDEHNLANFHHNLPNVQHDITVLQHYVSDSGSHHSKSMTGSISFLIFTAVPLLPFILS